VSELPFDRHRDDGGEPECRQLLEMHQVRRRLERRTIAGRAIPRAALAVTERTHVAIPHRSDCSVVSASPRIGQPVSSFRDVGSSAFVR
jgi:hypothetical protein